MFGVNMENILKRLNHQLNRLKERQSVLNKKYKGKETTVYNFYGGYDLGYVNGKIEFIENIIDVITNEGLE